MFAVKVKIPLSEFGKMGKQLAKSPKFQFYSRLDQTLETFGFAEKVRELSGSKSEIMHVPYDEAYEEGFEDMPRRVPDISKVSALTGFRPTMPLDGILQSVIEYYSGRQSNGRT